LDLPHLAKRAFGDQMGPNVQKAMPPRSLLHQGLKNCELSQFFFVFRPFSGPTGAIFAVSALPAMFCSWNTFWRFWPHQEG
jgi:hypothetical protein